MNKKMQKSTGHLMLLALLLLGLLAAGGAPANEPTCNTYWNSRVAEIDPIGYTCAYSGRWCLECYGGGTACWKDDDSWGAGPCGPYQQMP